MKLASYKDGSRDGQLVVVSRDLSQAHYVSATANRLQSVLDDWNYLSAQLQDLSDALNAGKARHAFPFDPARCMAPLPRAYQWLHGMAYTPFLESQLAQVQVGGADEPSSPVLAQGCGDDFLGPCDAMLLTDSAWELDFEAQWAAITGDVPQGCAPERALDSVRLLVLANQPHLHALDAPAGSPGGPGLAGRPAAAFSPVAVTPDELGEAWSRGRVALTLQCTWNGRKVGMCEAQSDMAFSMGRLIAEAARTRRLRAGTVIGTGPVANRGVEKGGRMQWPRGYSAISVRRAMEMALDGQPATPYLQHGDTVRIDMKNAAGQSVFGAIEQVVQAPGQES